MIAAIDLAYISTTQTSDRLARLKTLLQGRKPTDFECHECKQRMTCDFAFDEKCEQGCIYRSI